MSESLGTSVLDLSVDDSGLESGLTSAEGTTKSRMGAIAGTVGKAAAVGTAALAAAGAAAAGAAFKTADYGDEVAKTSTKMGIGVESLQEMRYWAERNGISAQSMDRAVGRLNQRIGRAIDGNDKYAEAFDTLGVSITDTEGNARSTNDVMGDTIAALSQIEDPALQSARASEIFGTKMARDLMPALQDGALSLDEAAQMANELGIVMDGETAAAAERFGDQWADIKDQVTGFVRDAAAPLMVWMGDVLFPAINEGIGYLRDLWGVFQEGEGVVGGIRAVFGELAEGMGGEGGLFTALLEAAQSAIGALVEWLASGGITQILEFVMESRTRLLEAAMELFPAILEAAVAFFPDLVSWFAGDFVPTLVDFLIGAVPQLLDAAITLFTSLLDAVLTVLPDLIGTLLGDLLPEVLTTILGMIPDLLTTAVELFLMLVEAVLDILPDLLGVLLGEVLPNLLTTILGMIPQLLVAGVEAFMALVTAVVEMLPELINILLVEVLPSLITTIISMIPELLEAGIETFLALVDAVLKALPDLLGTITGDLIPGVIDTIMELGPKMLSAGKEIIGNLIDGIKSMIGNVKDSIGEVTGTIRNSLPFSPAKEGPLSGRGSPELAGAKIGEMISDGLDSADVSASMHRLVDVDLGALNASAGSMSPAVLALLAEIRDAVAADREINIDGKAVGRQLSEAFA